MIITLAEYARRHGRDRNTVYNLRRSGRLPEAVKVGGTWLIDENVPYPEDLRIYNAKNLPQVRKKLEADANKSK